MQLPPDANISVRTITDVLETSRAVALLMKLHLLIKPVIQAIVQVYNIKL